MTWVTTAICAGVIIGILIFIAITLLEISKKLGELND